jgi:hypothetical protein
MHIVMQCLPTAAAAQCMARQHSMIPAIQSQCSTSYTVHAPFKAHKQHIVRKQALIARMGIRAVESFDSTFELSQECRSSLTALLSSDTFCQQVSGTWCATPKLADVHTVCSCCMLYIWRAMYMCMLHGKSHGCQYSTRMLPQVCGETKQQEGTQLRFADILFQPVPWSVQTKKVAAIV